MKRYKIFQIVLIAIISALYMTSCSTSSDLPYDDVYYSAKKSNTKTLSQSNLSNDVYESSSSTGDYQSYYNGENSTSTDVPVGAGAYGNDYSSGDENYSDEDIYYDSDYESRINRFNNEGSSMGYYDDYYTGDGCNCSGGSNWNMSFGIGMGLGWGMSYGYGWPYYGYPSYGWGYPYYGWGYPSYGWGYPHYGYPYYGGGYYPDYGYGYASTYRPRGSHGGGTNVPRTGSRGSSGISNPTYGEKTVVAGGGTFNTRSDGAYTSGSGTVGNGSTRPAGSIRVNPGTLPSTSVADKSSKQRIDKPRSQGQVSAKETSNTERYRKPKQSTRAAVSQKPRYEKPKSYRTLPTQQTRSSKEYAAPKKINQSSRQPTNTNVRTNTRKPVNQPNTNYNRNTNTRSNVNRSASVKQNNTRTRSTTTRSTTKLSTPSRSKSTPSRSYSTPSRSYSSPSRSYSSPSKSSSSSSGGSNRSSGGGSSSSSSSRSSGGRR